MEVHLTCSFLPLLFLVWLPTGTVSQPEEPDFTVECKVKIWLENLMVHVKWYKCADLRVRNQINTTGLGENTTHVTSSAVCAASTGVCECVVLLTRTNLTDTGNGTKAMVLSCGPEAPQKKIWTELTFLLCILSGLAIGTLLYMPVICILLWHLQGPSARTRKGKGKVTSRQVVEGSQLSTAAAEDLTYANLKFEQGKVASSSSSDVVYTEVKAPKGKPEAKAQGEGK